jgi:hypothetical protein
MNFDLDQIGNISMECDKFAERPAYLVELSAWQRQYLFTLSGELPVIYLPVTWLCSRAGLLFFALESLKGVTATASDRQ